MVDFRSMILSAPIELNRCKCQWNTNKISLDSFSSIESILRTNKQSMMVFGSLKKMAQPSQSK